MARQAVKHLPSSSGLDDGLPSIDKWPNDVPIVSIRDARRRLALADEYIYDLLNLAHELDHLMREALEAAGCFTFKVACDPVLQRSLLATVSAPPKWGNKWAADLISSGGHGDYLRRNQALRRVGGYVGIPLAEIRAVTEAISECYHFVSRTRPLSKQLAELQDVHMEILAAHEDYMTLRDTIAGALDRMQAAEDGDRHGEAYNRNRTPDLSHISTNQPVPPRGQKTNDREQKRKRGRPRLEDQANQQSRARFSLYMVIKSRRQEGASRQALADLLNSDRGIRELATEAGLVNGVTAHTIRQAEQFARDRQKKCIGR
jgi:hypothetical protein